MLNRIFGLETEYGLLVHEDPATHSPTWFAHKIRDYLFHKQKQGVLDMHHRAYDEPPGNGGFLRNAGRIYLDMGHIEYASPECGSLTDLVAVDRAGDRLIQDAIEAMGFGDTVSLIKNNIDHETDATFGSHENYLVTRNFPFTYKGLGKLVPFLVTRQLFTGSGRIGASDTGDGLILLDPRNGQPMRPSRAPEIPFQISQRADHIVNDFFEWVQGNRAIVNTRDEPLADPEQFRRIHLLLGDSNMAEVATALKLGTTGLVLQLIEEGHAPTGFDFDDAVETLKEVSRDQDRTWLVQLASGKTLSAIDIQEEFLSAASKHYRGQDEETDWVLREWEQVLADLRQDYTKLVGKVDWASKLWLLESFREAEKLEWDDPWLKSLDLEYHNLCATKGLYFGLQDEGKATRITTDSAVRLAQTTPPRNTRAFGRGEVIKHLIEQEPAATSPHDRERQPQYVVNWSAFQLLGRAPFIMENPFKTYAKEVREHLMPDDQV